jgi:hypothetical protein
MPALLLTASCPAIAQQSDGISRSEPGLVAPSQPDAERTLWVAGVAGGYIDRSTGQDSPYATASLTRYRGDFYVRAGATIYQSEIQQVDAALPSTYVIGSLGFGGTWHGWVFDLYGSAGNQRFGQITTALGARDSMAGHDTGYLALGARAGRRFALADSTTLTGTVSINYADTRSLRHAIIGGMPTDLQLPERSLTGSAAIRIDRSLGKTGRSQIGLSLEHFESDNGSTLLSFAQGAVPAQPGSPPTFDPVATKTPDSWQEAGLSGTFPVAKSLWLDTEIRRTFGSVSGDATTLSLGLRLKI